MLLVSAAQKHAHASVARLKACILLAAHCVLTRQSRHNKQANQSYLHNRYHTINTRQAVDPDLA
jgi:hypothetical protein